jgi:tetratricopeptide (TPR) repeat protein
MNSPLDAAALQGDALHAFLDQVQELLYGDDEQPAGNGQGAINRQDRTAAAIELLEQQSFAPASVMELERLHDFWLMLDRPRQAHALLQAHGEAALQAQDAGEHAESAVRLALSGIQSQLHFDRDGALQQLLPAARQIAELPGHVDAGMYWMGWESLADGAQAWDIAEQGVDLRRAHEKADPDHAEALAFGDAMACVRKAEIACRRDPAAAATTALRHIQAAIDTLRNAGTDPSADFDHWLLLGHRILELAPQSIPSLLMACEQYLARTEEPAPSQAVKAHRQVKIVRLQAQACHQTGQHEAALQLALQGRVSLTDDPGDPFSALVLRWLQEAGRLDEAAAIALESVIHSRPGSAVAGYRMALELLDQDAAHADTWALILAWAQIDEDMRQLLAQEEMPPQPAAHYLERVRANAPGHPVLALIEGMRLASKRQMDKALPLLEQSVGRHPEFADGDKLSALWAARFAALPLQEALARPFPEAHGAHWCYAAGVVLDDADDLAPLMGGKKKVPPQETREPLVVRYYEAGLARFERFWATGRGGFKDADLHVYSMLCNNLAIKYRDMERWDEAEALHRKGLASSPFAEHQDGLWWCANGRDDAAGIVAEAERLWHFAQEHGYGRHEPPRYFPTVALSLYKLDRGDEISIWLERLDEWYAELDEGEQRQERRDYLAAMMSLLDFFSVFRPELVLPRLRAHQDEVRALQDSYPLRRLAGALEAWPELLEEAVALHREAASHLGKHARQHFALGNDNETEARISRDCVEKAERKLAEHRAAATASGRKPWWKFW